jgi:hydroxyethylthiazole kinase-like uncharacterized protein yjeF
MGVETGDLDEETLRAHGARDLGGGDKFDRGQVVIIGGEAEVPGGVLLAALAALRAGAGRAHVVTDRAVALPLAVAALELRVSALPLGAHGVDLSASPPLVDAVQHADAVLVGTACTDRSLAGRLLEQAAPLIASDARLVVDAAALACLADAPSIISGIEARTTLLPNVAEAGELLHRPPASVEADPAAACAELVARFATSVAVRGAVTAIGDPSAGPYVERGGHAALGTSGSGDVLAGVVAGLAARGASALTATMLGVHVHAQSGAALAMRDGGLGLLARDLLDVLPRHLNAALG